MSTDSPISVRRRRRHKLAVALATLVVTVALTLVAPDTAQACQPCPPDSMLDLEASVQGATLVVVARRAETQPDPGNGPADWPERLAVDVTEVLAGELPEGTDTIVVRSWFGMCPYGILIKEGDDREHVLILKPPHEDTPVPDAWSPVSTCAVKALVIDGGSVELDGEAIAREDLAEAIARIRAGTPASASDNDDDN